MTLTGNESSRLTAPEEPAKATHDAVQVLTVLDEAVRCGRLTSRDAAIWSASVGLRPLPEGPAEAPLLHGISDRRARQIIASVSAMIDTPFVPAPVRPQLTSSQVSDRGVALFGAEIDLSTSRRRAAAIRSLEVISARRTGKPVSRTHVPASDRARKSAQRIRPHALARAYDLTVDPSLSTAFPFLVQPTRLPERLAVLVPAMEARRGRRPTEEWLCELSLSLAQAYSRKEDDLDDLVAIAAWAFGQAPGLMPDIEANVMAVAASVAQEGGRLSALWFAERVRRLTCPEDLRVAHSAHDSAIVLRNHGFTDAANMTLLKAMRGLDDAKHDTVQAKQVRCRLLSQLAYNATLEYSSYQRGTREEGVVRRLLDELEAAASLLGEAVWVGTARSSKFEFELLRAKRTAESGRQRPHVSTSAWKMFDDASNAVAVGGVPVRLSQWEIMRINAGLTASDDALIIQGVDELGKIVDLHPWIARRHTGELRRAVRLGEIAVNRKLMSAANLEHLRALLPTEQPSEVE